MSAYRAMVSRGNWSARRRERWAAAVFLAPDVLGFLVFLFVPVLLAFGLAFFEVSGFGDISFVGLDNYRRMLGDALFRESLLVTLIYVVAMVPGVFVASLGLALLVRRKMPFVGALRAAFFLPHVISLVVAGLVWQFLLADRVGLVNRLLRAVGLSGVSWLGDPRYALLTVLVVSIWFYMGYYMIIFLAGLQDIPREYYDAARVDGAGGFAMFRHVTWPLLKPTSFFVAVVATVAAVSGAQAFDLIYVLTQGGPVNSTSLGMFYIYQQAFQYNDFGYAAALASVFVLALLVITGVMFWVTKGGRFDTAER